LKRGLGRLQARLKNQPGIKWVDPNSIHLTLKFLGNIAVGRTGEITRAMEEASGGIPPFHLETGELGVFPNLKRVQVAWVGLGGEIDNLARLQQRIEANLASLGFAPELRPFTPHLTLARVREGVSVEERQRFGEVIASASLDMKYVIGVNAVSLMKSELTRQGAIYSRISSAGLTEPLSTAPI
jgi:2'-5' RNA ligase